ncbi:Ubiquitin carboxyl-terminal hydrolase 31 [Halotydeus destructor]|nr:Ubiquitin carboxyl-terminal hydrolase 31 [Halotydeus destructor]
MMNSSTLPRRCESSPEQHQATAKRSLLSRLFRHFSSSSISSTSSPSRSYERFGSSLDRRSSRKSSHSSQNSGSARISNGIPTSMSNGELGSKASATFPINLPSTGLKNHGNTCFMNAVIQCLSNTDLLAEYFVMGHYKLDMLRHNKIHAKKYGTKGEVTNQLAVLLKSLWTNQYSSEISFKFKQLVSKHGAQYEGNDQHDAQEFLLWLLDKVHEDLNIAPKRKYKKFQPSNGPHISLPDEVLASETFANHMRCNNSFIHELFQAQLRSSLVCRSCGKRSNTFDPYMCLSLPVPTRQTHAIVVNVTYVQKKPRQLKIAVSIESQASLRELRDKISRLIKVPEKQLLLLKNDTDTGYKELSRDADIIQDILGDMQEIYGLETPSLQSHNVSTDLLSSDIPSLPSDTSQRLTIVWKNAISGSGPSSMFGPFFACQVSRESSFKQIQTEMISSMASIVRTSVESKIISDSVLFSLRVISGYDMKNYLPDDVDHPLYMPCIDKALVTCEYKDYRGPIHLKLVVEWDSDVRHSILVADNELPLPVVDSNIEYVKARTQKSNRASLQDCFDLYFREEKLVADNAWMCPACRRRQQCNKQLGLWSVPDVFVVHLKRFRQLSTAQRSKLSTLVLFPLSGLDMNAYLVARKLSKNGTSTLPRSQTNGYSTLKTTKSSSATLPASGWSTLQKPRLKKPSHQSEENNVYDLYAVCNHHGNMQGGHYTAYCKSPVDGRWNSYDDNKVSSLSEASVITADAYILFYQKSYLSSTSAPPTSSSGYSSSSSHYSTESHWMHRLPPLISKSSKSQDNLITSRTTSLTKINGTTNDKSQIANGGHISRSNKAYSSLPAKSDRISSRLKAQQESTREILSKQLGEVKSRSSSTPPSKATSVNKPATLEKSFKFNDSSVSKEKRIPECTILSSSSPASPASPVDDANSSCISSASSTSPIHSQSANKDIITKKFTVTSV